MRTIILERLTIEGFKSFSNETVVEFSPVPGFRFLSGANEVEPRLGSNGAGKSSLWDALIWCLYGTAARAGRTSDLTNWNAKRASVEVQFSINAEPTFVTRTGSPNRLQLNGEDAEQREIDEYFGLSRDQFVQSVIFGQNVKLFLDLPLPERAALLDQVLDLSLWMRASDLATAQGRISENKLQSIQRDIAHAEGRLQSIEDIDALEKQAERWKKEYEAQVDAAISVVEEAERYEKQLQAELKKVKANENYKEFNQSAIERMDNNLVAMDATMRRHEYDASIFKFRIEENEKTLKFYKEHAEVCPACNQTISARQADAETRKAVKTIDGAKLSLQMTGGDQNKLHDEMDALRDMLEKAKRKRDFFAGQHAELEKQIREQNRAIDRAVDAAEQIAATKNNPYAERLIAAKTLRLQAQEDLTAHQIAEKAERASAAKVDYWRQGFKRVRLFLIKRVLAHLEIEVSNAANVLGLVDWHIGFSTEIETKSNTLKAGVHIQVTSPQTSSPWETWSGGEGQRVRLAVAIGFSNLIQRMAGVSYNFEVWDEPSSWLSTEGVEDLLECLRYRAEAERKSVWLLDHRALATSGFAEIWCVRKTTAGSSVELLTQSG